MLDRDLAALYGVETSYLKRQVKRNIERFPEDFMFQLSKEELGNWRCQFVTSNSTDKMGLRYKPMEIGKGEKGVEMILFITPFLRLKHKNRLKREDNESNDSN